MSEHAHPAPHRHRVSTALLAFALLATPAVWGMRLVANYAINSHFCFPGDQHGIRLPGWAWPTLLGLDLLAIVVAIAAAVIAFGCLRQSRHETNAAYGPLIEIGEGRTRFLSLWGVMIGLGFVLAVGFDLVALWIAPPCG
jgi:hypothetical protein